MATVDRFEGQGWLEWWANPVTLLGSVNVWLTVTFEETGWEAHGRLTNDEDHEEFAFFCDLDPVFTLRFDDHSTIDVTVHPTDDRRQFQLTEYTGPTQRPVDHHMALQTEPSSQPPSLDQAPFHGSRWPDVSPTSRDST